MRGPSWVVVVLFVFSCGSGIASLDTPDADQQEMRDAGLAVDDAGRDAGGALDAGEGLDGGRMSDAGEADAGTADAGPSDAGPSGLDAGASTDAGQADAGRPDAGMPRDAGTADAGPSSSRQTPRPRGSTDAGNGYFEYLPPGYSNSPTWPLLVFWHGLGENGNGVSELSRVLTNGPPSIISQNQWPAARPFVVLSPQHSGGGCPTAPEIRDFISFAMSTYAIDPKEVFLTGLSCGAIGSFQYLNDQLNNQVAAAVLIAGDPGDPNASWSLWGRRGCDAGTVAMFSFHGSADGVVPPGNNRETFSRLAGCAAPPARETRYVEFPGVGHDSWTRVYNLSSGHDVYAWLLANSKP